MASAATVQRRDDVDSPKLNSHLPNLFSLECVGKVPDLIYSTFMFANDSAYIGNAKYDLSSEPLLFDKKTAFTSFHASPTGWQNLYIFPNETAPVGFTTPHSMAVPKGAREYGFTDDDKMFKYDSGEGPKAKWAVCPVKEQAGSWQLYWKGGKKLAKDCVCIKLKIHKKRECRQ
ncbi:hypothetical protein K440DRAFT_618635 [Wilcoxina mikolae CBS 423.85]|nr:hypothetical protein K440DRAFT_618635 [Wilcoxina mikolae CBS 423.85]